MRMKIFKEFSGSQDDEVLRDPLSEEFAKFWEEVASKNTELYR